MHEDITRDYPAAVSGRFNIGLLHTALEGYAQHAPYAPCTLPGLASKGYAYWALGHVHERQELSQDPWIIFPGNLQGRHARETGPKGATLVDVSHGQVTSVRPLHLDVVRWARIVVDCEGTQRLEDIHARVQASLAKAHGEVAGRGLVGRVVLTGGTPLAALLSDRRALLR